VTRALEGDAVRLSASFADGAETSTDYRGMGQFSLGPGALPAWVRVEPTDSRLLATLQALASAPPNLELVIFQRAVLSDVSEGFTINPVALDPLRGHALLQFLDEPGRPLNDVSVEAPLGGAIGYDVGVTYSDSTQGTSERGAAVLFNGPVVASPGLELLVRQAQRSTTIQLPLEQDTLTIAVFRLEADQDP